MGKVFAAANIWALGADEAQWILYRAMGKAEWRPISYVSSTKKVLAERMREAGVEPSVRTKLLEGLPDTFREFKTSGRTS